MQRSRRHTIARPASALRLLATDSDTDNEDNDQQQQNQMDRISDMLSILIHEANEAVSHKKTIATLRKPNSSLDMHQLSILQRKRPARPMSYPSSSRRLAKRRSSTVLIQEQAILQSNSRSSSSLRRSLTPGNKSLTRKNDQVMATSPLAESFKRLDSSLAVVDSLSRDLAFVSVPPPPHTPSSDTLFHGAYNKELISAFHILPFDSRLSMLLLLPLLHLPHAFISVVFGSLLSYDDHDHTDSASSFTGILVWVVMFGFTNIIMDQTSSITKQGKRKWLPGAFGLNALGKKRKSVGSQRQKSMMMKRRHSF